MSKVLRTQTSSRANTIRIIVGELRLRNLYHHTIFNLQGIPFILYHSTWRLNACICRFIAHLSTKHLLFDRLHLVSHEETLGQSYLIRQPWPRELDPVERRQS